MAILFGEVEKWEICFSLTPVSMQKIQQLRSSRSAITLHSDSGLAFRSSRFRVLVEKRFETLRDTGRIEFEEGILKKLIYEFCDSPYITQDNYEDTILELQDSFYYFKNESMDLISDDELISFMKKHFDTTCQGSLEYLSGASLEELCRNTRYGYKIDGKDMYGRPF